MCSSLWAVELHYADLFISCWQTGRGVPLLVPEECQEVLSYLASAVTRRAAGISPSNPYMFPASRKFYFIDQIIVLEFLTWLGMTFNALIGGEGVVRAYSSLSSICRRANLKEPEMVTSVTLRKYMATVTQVGIIAKSDDAALCINCTELKWPPCMFQSLF